MKEILGEHSFPNGRRYLITDTSKPYVGGEYPSGGLLIRLWSKVSGWIFLDHSPGEEEVRAFLRAASRLGPLPE